MRETADVLRGWVARGVSVDRPCMKGWGGGDNWGVGTGGAGAPERSVCDTQVHSVRTRLTLQCFPSISPLLSSPLSSFLIPCSLVHNSLWALSILGQYASGFNEEISAIFTVSLIFSPKNSEFLSNFRVCNSTGD
eukprot:767506-Hanusia_phi.AAC.2